MGKFDEFSAKVKCADCGYINQIKYEQTKNFTGYFTHYLEGNSVLNGNHIGDDRHPQYGFFTTSIGKYWFENIPNNTCENCGSAMEIIGIVRNNVIMRILDGRILRKEVIKRYGIFNNLKCKIMKIVKISAMMEYEYLKRTNLF